MRLGQVLLAGLLKGTTTPSHQWAQSLSWSGDYTQNLHPRLPSNCVRHMLRTLANAWREPSESDRFDARTLARLARIDPDLLGPV